MSVVIAIKEKNRIILGCDSQNTNTQLKEKLTKNSYKIWAVKNLDQAIMGGVGNKRDCQLIQIQEHLIDELTILKNKINYDYVVGTLFTTIYDILVKYNCVERDEHGNFNNHIESSFIFAYKNKAYLIDTFGGVAEIEDYLVMGSGEEIAIGVLEETKDLPAEDRIKRAIKACADKTLYIDNNIIIKSTKN